MQFLIHTALPLANDSQLGLTESNQALQRMSARAARQLQRHSQHGLPSPSRHVLLGLILLRTLNAFCTGRTFFQPDEYFQALEPAWNLAFGPNSGAWLTWEWKYHLRSSLHPALFALLYAFVAKVLAFLPCLPPTQASLLIVLPKLLQACFAVLADFYTWKLAEKVYGQGSRSAWAALCVTALSPWHWHCSTRTFSNSLEMTLTIVALYYWPWELTGDASDIYTSIVVRRARLARLRISLFLAAVAVLLRPTNMLIWATVVATALTRLTLRGQTPVTFRVLFALSRESVLCGSAGLALSAVSDYLYYGELTFPPYHWLRFNLSEDVAVFYGEMAWHYYLSQGITQLTMTFLPFALAGLYRFSTSSTPTSTALQSNSLRTLSYAVIATTAVLSLISHKEVRFIYPLLPILHILAAPSFAQFFSAAPGRQPSQVQTAILAGLIFVNVMIAAYISLFHAAAPVSVVHFLRHEYERIHPNHLNIGRVQGERGSESEELFALFATPCHATPWRSHFIYPSLRARALTCEPPLHTAPRSGERQAYMDEADRFFHGFRPGADDWGVDFLAKEMWPLIRDENGSENIGRGGEIPRYIVGFESIEAPLRRFFDKDGDGAGEEVGVKLRTVWRGWNGLFSDDERKGGSLMVWDTGLYPDGPGTP